MTKSDSPIGIAISKAPDGPREKRDSWENQMMRIQIAMWLDDKCVCLYCKHKYTSVDDFIKRNPVKGHSEDFTFVCTKCYPKYKATLKKAPPS